MINGIKNAPCLTCRKKNRSDSLGQLRRIRMFFLERRTAVVNGLDRQYPIEDALRNSVHIRCPYGMSCPSIIGMASEADRLIMELGRLFRGYLQAADDGDIGDVLRLLQGHFPQAYTCTEQYWKILKNSRK